MHSLAGWIDTKVEYHFQRRTNTLTQHFSLVYSEKHLVGQDRGWLEPIPAPQYRAAVA